MILVHLRFFIFFALLLLGGFVLSPSLGGIAQAAVVSKISVEGNTRVDEETIRVYLRVEPGRPFEQAQIDDSLKALFATGLFSEVDIHQADSVLVVRVKENPVIARISFEGNKKVKDAQILSILKSQERSVLTQTQIRTDVERILEAYRRAGRFRATVEPKIISLPHNQVDLVFEINEGPKIGVARINFIGNKAFSNRQLLDVVQTHQTGLLSWLRGDDVYDPDRLVGDQERLRRFYHNRGYVDFEIVSAVADLDPERNAFVVTFVLEEGELYHYGEVEIETFLSSLDPALLSEQVVTKKGSVYDARAVENTVQKITVEAARQGYPFVQVRPRLSPDKATRTIAVTYQVDEGARAYIERIDISGNDRTRDYVIRREFDFVEGDPYNHTMVMRSERRLRNLGFFKSVSVAALPGTAPDRVVLDVKVEEQPTGEISFGLGYSTSDGILGDVSLTERNFLGRGQSVSLNLGGGEDAQSYALSFTEPYFLGRRLSFSFDLYRQDYQSNDYRSYDESIVGGGIAFGFPLRDDLTMRVFYKIYNRDVSDVDENASPALKDSAGSTLTSLAGYALTYNTVDNLRDPTEGRYAKFQQEVAGLGGDASYLRTTAEARQYHQLNADWGLVGVVRVSGGYIHGLGKRLQIQDQFFKGGETIRGFQASGFGPRDNSTPDEDPLGGRAFVAGSVEANFPMPFIPEEFGFVGAVFADAGSLWDADPESTTAVGATVVSNSFRLRASAGVGIQWASPFGPLRADLAYPFLKDDYDETQIFRLGAGTRF